MIVRHYVLLGTSVCIVPAKIHEHVAAAHRRPIRKQQSCLCFAAAWRDTTVDTVTVFGTDGTRSESMGNGMPTRFCRCDLNRRTLVVPLLIIVTRAPAARSSASSSLKDPQLNRTRLLYRPSSTYIGNKKLLPEHINTIDRTSKLLCLAIVAVLDAATAAALTPTICFKSCRSFDKKGISKWFLRDGL
jgi:hypothetical protein